MEGGGGFKLFGVRFPSDPQQSPPASGSIQMRKSVSMGNLSSYGGGRERERARERERERERGKERGVQETEESMESGYVSDDLVHSNSSSRERKKGVAWTEEEHRAFLLGLEELGKGDWRGISRKFVKTRTPTQVASHAQKHFLRKNNLNKRRRRSSLFDITADSVSSFLGEPLLEEAGCNEEDVDACPELRLGQAITYESRSNVDLAQFSWRSRQYINGFSTRMPILSESTELVGTASNMDITEMAQNCSLIAASGEGEGEGEGEGASGVGEIRDKGDSNPDSSTFRHLPLIPPWLGQSSNGFEIVKPTPIVPRPHMKVEDLKASASELCADAVRLVMEPSALSYQLLEEGSRHSAFQTTSSLANSSSNSSSVSSGSGREMDGKPSLTHVNAISVP